RRVGDEARAVFASAAVGGRETDRRAHAMLSHQAADAHTGPPCPRVPNASRHARWRAGPRLRCPDRSAMLRTPLVREPPLSAATPTQSTATLLARVRAGDAAAREQLCAQYLPLLMRWAHGRLPAAARDLAETADLVQMTLIKALGRIDEFESRHEGAFLAYLRSALLNALRNEIE